MKVLVVKLTSMGDAIHLLPALTDLQANHKDVTVDWMIEDSFAEIPKWHPNVDRVIRVYTRQWRKLSWSNLTSFTAFVRHLRQTEYDVVIDAQGLMKSALLARFAKLRKGGRRPGYSADSIKESPAARFYSKRIAVPRTLHAIERLQLLFAGAFDYPHQPQHPPAYGIDFGNSNEKAEPYQQILLFPSTTWKSKHIQDQTWRDIVDEAVASGYQVKISWGNSLEKDRAKWIAESNVGAQILPKSSLNDLAKELLCSRGCHRGGHWTRPFGGSARSAYGFYIWCHQCATNGRHRASRKFIYSAN